MQVFILLKDILTQDIFIVHVYCKSKEKKKWPNLTLIKSSTTVDIFNVYMARGVLSIDCGL